MRYVGTDWSAEVVPIPPLRWYRFMRYDGTVSPILSTNLKKLIENLLDKTAEEYDDSEAYRYMTENYPDGKVKLEKNERKEFMDWLGVVEK